MGRNKAQDAVNVEAQVSPAVRQQQAGNGNSGSSLLDLNAPYCQPRHSESGERRRTQGTPSYCRSSNRPDVFVQSPARDEVDDTNPTLAMPPPSRIRLNRSATAPLEARRSSSTGEGHLDVERLAIARRHSERLESPETARRRRHRSPSEPEPDTDSDVVSGLSDGSGHFGHIRKIQDLRDMVEEEADDEAPRRRRRRSTGPDSSRRKGKGRSRSRSTYSIRSHSDEQSNHHRELVVRDDPSLTQQSDYEYEQAPAPDTRSRRRSEKAPAEPRIRRSPQRTHRRNGQSSRTVPEPPRSQRASTVASSRSSSASVRRPTNVLSGFFKAPTPPKKHSKHTASGSAHKSALAHSERFECVICMSDVSVKKAAHLKCDHHMCNTCLKRAFVLSVEDSTHMPPKCCTKDHIQPKHVERLFDLPFKKTWNRKFVEYTTKNRLYCPAKRCGHFIKPSRIKVEKGRKYARCGHCDTKVCAKCNNRWHKTVDCPQDQTINDFLAQAKDEGWQRCYQCRAMVELREGCNHMTCRCGAEFCMICGTKWKGCDCPWFNDEAIAADRRRHMNEVSPPPRGGIDNIFLGRGPPIPPELRGTPNFGAAPLPMRPMVYSYPGQARVDVRQLQEQDEQAVMARHIPAYQNLDDEYTAGVYDMQGGQTVLGVANSAPHHINYDYHRGSQSMINSSAPPLSAHYDRASVGDYVSDVSRARGVREDSMERRLAERLAERPSASLTSIQPTVMSSIGQYAPGPPVYSYAGLTPSGGVVPAAGTPVMMQSYAYSTPQIAMDALYSRMQAPAPYHLSMPAYEECYEQRRIEVNTPRRRRRAQERERNAEAQRGRRSSSSAVAMTTTEVKSSSLAGLTGPGRGMDRVAEWSYHVAPGMPASTAGDDK